jgi:hypothetical protein
MKALASILRLLALAGALLAPSLPAQGKDLIWGVNGHPLVSYPGVSLEQQLDLVKALGMRSYRVDVTRFDQMERFGQLVAAARARGIEILPILMPPVNLDQSDEASLQRGAFAFAEAFARRFAPDISVWELGNEMEIYALLKPCELRDDGSVYPCEWGLASGVGPGDYFGPRLAKVFAVLRGLSDAVKAADPTARRAIGTGGWSRTGFFERLRAAGLEWEISVWHMYAEDPEPAFKILASFGKPIWVTEFNHDYGSQRDGEAGQAEGLTRTMRRLRELAGLYNVEAAHIYELLDETYWAPDFEAFMGLVRLDKAGEGWALGGPKAAFEAVRAVIANPREAAR